MHELKELSPRLGLCLCKLFEGGSVIEFRDSGRGLRLLDFCFHTLNISGRRFFSKLVFLVI